MQMQEQSTEYHEALETFLLLKNRPEPQAGDVFSDLRMKRDARNALHDAYKPDAASINACVDQIIGDPTLPGPSTAYARAVEEAIAMLREGHVNTVLSTGTFPLFSREYLTTECWY
jgi:hypothetical protein